MPYNRDDLKGSQAALSNEAKNENNRAVSRYSTKDIQSIRVEAYLAVENKGGPYPFSGKSNWFCMIPKGGGVLFVRNDFPEQITCELTVRVNDPSNQWEVTMNGKSVNHSTFQIPCGDKSFSEGYIQAILDFFKETFIERSSGGINACSFLLKRRANSDQVSGTHEIEVVADVKIIPSAAAKANRYELVESTEFTLTATTTLEI